jgi:hypothetical protein
MLSTSAGPHVPARAACAQASGARMVRAPCAASRVVGTPTARTSSGMSYYARATQTNLAWESRNGIRVDCPCPGVVCDVGVVMAWHGRDMTCQLARMSWEWHERDSPCHARASTWHGELRACHAEAWVWHVTSLPCHDGAGAMRVHVITTPKPLLSRPCQQACHITPMPFRGMADACVIQMFSPIPYKDAM